MDGVKLRKFIFSLLAGAGATTAHIALMAIKHRAGILPEFEPYEDLQRMLASATAQTSSRRRCCCSRTSTGR